MPDESAWRTFLNEARIGCEAMSAISPREDDVSGLTVFERMAQVSIPVQHCPSRSTECEVCPPTLNMERVMSRESSNLSPAITTMIRLDHMHVLAAFHRYHRDSAWWRKRAIVNSVCAALEIHAQLEEEILYPALAEVAATNQSLQASRPAHDAVRATIRELRATGPENAAYDALFMQLMRDTLHHVADEETVLLPMAERALKQQLRSLGADMTRRRIELLKERPTEVAVNTMRTFPLATLALATAFVVCLTCAVRGNVRRRHG
jgi:iron-sulfur cluster repair protein YtfE (RIC family)